MSMRIKTYYTQDEIQNDLYTLGDEFMTTDGEMYIGPYHRYTTTNEIFTQSKWNLRLSQKLVVIQNIPDAIKTYQTLRDIRTRFQIPTNTPVNITSKDIQAGTITRYFCKKTNNEAVIEINKMQYDAWQNETIDRIMYVAVKLPWRITGDLQDIKINNAVIPGVISHNKDAIKQTLTTIPQLATHLADFTEYYVGDDFVIPKDINGLDS